MRKTGIIASLLFLVVAFSMCRKAATLSEEEFDERLSGGMATVFDETSGAFGHAIVGLTGRDARVHDLGDIGFEQTFVSAPSPINSGLGPVFNNVSCVSCHHNDGKGVPTAGAVNSSLLFRISTPGANEFGGPSGVAGYGAQLQDLAIFGKHPEGKVSIQYTLTTITYPDGNSAQLRQPQYTLTNTYTEMPAGAVLSPRLAPPVFGLGLLELIPESTIISFADEQDVDGDGISGRPNYVYNPQTRRKEIGRFGLKANTPTISVQVASAFHQDMGITSSMFTRESTWGQPQADGLEDEPELADTTLTSVIFYIRTLAVPARRNVADVTVRNGKTLFAQAGCNGCHKAIVQTGVDQAIPAISNQRIQPYTDLLLHDMGSGLADGYTDFLANGSEWRTAPLWGIGLFEKTNGTPYYLHDGRARTIEEAILWHGGEGQKAADAFKGMNKSQRTALIQFIRSL
jgi:CxxC motif-containing protein (DUF1111 family)